MSATHPNYPSEYLFDGDYNTFAHDQYEPNLMNNGFKIKLELPYKAKVSQIKIFNRLDCCKNRLVGFEVYIIRDDGGGVYCGSITQTKDVYEFRCAGVGREIQIRTDNEVLDVNVAEVEIFGYGEYLRLKPGLKRWL